MGPFIYAFCWYISHLPHGHTSCLHIGWSLTLLKHSARDQHQHRNIIFLISKITSATNTVTIGRNQSQPSVFLECEPVDKLQLKHEIALYNALFRPRPFARFHLSWAKDHPTPADIPSLRLRSWMNMLRLWSENVWEQQPNHRPAIHNTNARKWTIKKTNINKFLHQRIQKSTAHLSYWAQQAKDTIPNSHSFSGALTNLIEDSGTLECTVFT